MNAKKCKAIRKIASGYESKPPVITTRFVLDEKLPGRGYYIVNPIRYPEDSRRRVYQDIKRLGGL